MQTIYQLNTDELDIGLLNSIKAQFPHKEIEIIVTEMDETEYLLRSSANREKLLSAVERIESGSDLIIPDQEQFR